MKQPIAPSSPRRMAWVLVLMYWLSLPSVTPAMLVALATFDLGHEVQVTFDQGHLDVVVHHEDDDCRVEVQGAPAVASCGMPHGHEHDHDHVLHFAATHDYRATSGAALSGPCVATIYRAYGDDKILPVALMVPAVARHAARPPPLSYQMVCLRTTVMLV